ncbi:hypothetical protein Tco_1028322 [Tanacetum coccineum]|uniref:Xylulose kinase-1 n=1 Tax=Tanacetum coccineum TaxID=301880 RepID=A0ABQ5G097_9ASTR
MVAFLTKPQGSEGFHQIVDFLNASHIRYALTETPTIYVSLINQFWCIASARTLNNGEIELIETVDGQEKTITKASVRRHLKLADADGISTLPTTEIFEQLALMGTTKTRSRRMGIRIPQSNVLSYVANEAITKEMHDGLRRATTTASSLEAEQGSGNISKTQTKATPSRLSSPRTSSEGGPGCHFTIGVVLFRLGLKGYLTYPMNHHSKKRMNSEAIYNTSLITLTKRVKKLENKLELKRRSTIVNSSEDEEASLDIKDPSKQGRMIEEIDQDENVNLVKSSKQGEAHETTEYRMESDLDFNTASPQNDDDELNLAETLIGHDEELAQKLHAKELAKSTARQEQEKYDFEKSLELKKQLDEREENRSFSVVEVKKNMYMYLKNQGGYKLSHFKGMKYEDIRPIFERTWDQNHDFVPKDSKIEKEVIKISGFIQKKSTEEEKEKKKHEESSKQVEEETVQKEDVIPEQVVNESSRKAEGRLKRKASKARGQGKDKRSRMIRTNLWKDVGYYEIHRADKSYKTYIFFSQMLNDFDREDLIVLYRLFNEKYASTRPGFDDLMLWGDMKVMFEPDREVSIHMLVEKKYSLPQDTLTRMLRWKLHVNYNVTEMAYELLRFIRSRLNQ